MHTNYPASWQAHAETFLQSIALKNGSLSTIAQRKEGLGVFFNWLHREVKIADLLEVKRTDICAYQRWMQIVKAWKTSTVHARLISVRRFFAHLETTGVILFNPCEGVTLPKLEDRLPKGVLTMAEVKKLLDAPDLSKPKGMRDRTLLEVFYATGIRRMEMISLNVQDVDLGAGLLRINCGKGAVDRMVPLGESASEWLRTYLQQVRRPWVRHHPEQSALWLSSMEPHHQPLTKEALQKIMEGNSQVAGVKVTAHLWRHTCATHLIQGGASVAHVQRILGHRSIDTTQLYTRVTVPEVQAMHGEKHPRGKGAPGTIQCELRTGGGVYGT